MSTATKSRPRVKPERRIHVLKPISDSSAGVIAITIDSKEDVYAVQRLSADFGVAYHIVKGELEEQEDNTLKLKNAAEYDVLLNGRESSCTCPGHTYRGHCKHVDGLTTLRQRNLI
jgi:hypothetical protein